MLEGAGVKLINSSELSAMIGQDNIVIVDIRDKASYSKGHIPGALALNSDQDVKDFLANADRQKIIVCCCFHGISSQNAAGYLQSQGFQDVRSLEGGFENWKIQEKVEI